MISLYGLVARCFFYVFLMVPIFFSLTFEFKAFAKESLPRSDFTSGRYDLSISKSITVWLGQGEEVKDLICLDVNGGVKQLVSSSEGQFLHNVLRPWVNGSLQSREGEANGVVFYKFNKDKVLVEKQGGVSVRQVSYYTLDLDNSGHPRTVEIVAGSYAEVDEGDGDIFWIYGEAWAGSEKNVSFDQVREAIELGYRNLAFIGGVKDFSYKYYLYPFFFSGKNYILIESSSVESSPRYIVAELVENKFLVLRCSF